METEQIKSLVIRINDVISQKEALQAEVNAKIGELNSLEAEINSLLEKDRKQKYESLMEEKSKLEETLKQLEAKRKEKIQSLQSQSEEERKKFCQKNGHVWQVISNSMNDYIYGNPAKQLLTIKCAICCQETKKYGYAFLTKDEQEERINKPIKKLFDKEIKYIKMSLSSFNDKICHELCMNYGHSIPIEALTAQKKQCYCKYCGRNISANYKISKAILKKLSNL